MKNDLTVEQIRDFNRFYTNILGLLNAHILDSPYTLTEVRILLEIKRTAACTANTLITKLSIDRGYMSRIIKRFESNGLITKESSQMDNRISFLRLTQKGKETMAALENKSDDQVKNLIEHISENDQRKLVKAMKYIKNTMLDGLRPISIRVFEPKDIAYVIDRHRSLYEAEFGFTSEFGDYVEEYVNKFVAHHDKSKETLWIAEENGAAVGVIAIVKVDDITAQLRWFLIEPELRGRGLGHRLMDAAIDYCKEKGYKHIFLWTVNILEPARHLYNAHGFSLTECKEHELWGHHLVEERWDLSL
ncbi:MAG: MarR family transcriptional regulator [Clostridiales bacterium GWB2_37_7]|nr:MAG: MarR family transcriptional regulator [Clostridiales bacterium GWB2_37_7]